jgi:hypothetical protein
MALAYQMVPRLEKLPKTPGGKRKLKKPPVFNGNTTLVLLMN